MKFSEIFIKAAELIDSGEIIYSSDAVLTVGNKTRRPCNYYSELMVMGSIPRAAKEMNITEKELRLTMLCMAAAVAESEGL